MSVGAVNKQTGERIPTAGMTAVDAVLSGTSTNPVQNKVVKEELDEKADTDMVAADFDATASYTAGNYCIYEGKFYKFKNNHSGAWSAADVDEIKIAGELASLRNGLIGVARGLVITGQSFTIDSSGNAIIDLPTELIGKTMLSISCSHFGTAQNPPYAWALLPDVNKYILYGAANDAYTNATINFVYM